MIASRNTLCALFATLGFSLLTGCAASVGDALDSRRNVGPCPSAGSLYEAARLIGLGRRTTWSLVNRNALPHRRCGRL